MDHTRDLPTAQPWRSAALAAATVAAIELCILLVAGAYLFGEFFAGEVEKAQDPVTVARAAGEQETAAGAREGPGRATRPLLARREVSVLVLNGNGVPGAASTAADRVHARNYVVAGTGNAPRSDFSRSVVMYRPGLAGEARRLARDVGIRRVAPLDGLRARDLQGAHVAIVVGG